jgi:YVTN family beta-propeller protein
MAERLKRVLLSARDAVHPPWEERMMPRHPVALVLGAALLVAASADCAAARAPSLLPTQQRVRLKGKEVELGLFPTGMALSADGRLALVTNNGFLLQSLTVVDTETLTAVNRQIGNIGGQVLFVGVALSPDGRTGYASGHTEIGFQDVVYTVTLAPGPTIKLGSPIQMPPGSFPAGMAMSPDGNRLYVAENLANKLAVIDTATTSITEVPVGRQPWGVAVHPTLPQVYVSNRVDRTVSIVDTESLEVIATVPAGNGPNAVAVSPNGAKIFIANASSDDLTVFDVNAPDSVRQVSLSPFPDARPGSSPNALAFSPDGTRLYVANAWDNDLAVVSPESETVVGLIPTGWYPSAIAVDPSNRTVYVANMKGARTFPRTAGRQLLDYKVNLQLGGTYGVHGTLEVLPVPGDRRLEFLTREVRYNNGFDTGHRPSNSLFPAGPCFPIPCNPGDPTPIKHVVMIVRENKTYDQLLSDVSRGDGAAKFLMYGQDITPNLHKLVDEFVLLDRFFADSEKSEPGHAWTTASIDSDYEEKTWTSTKGAGPSSVVGRPNDIGSQNPDTPGYVLPVAQPAGLYQFDNCYTHQVSFRNYGEFLRADETGTPIDYWVSNTDANYRPFDLTYSDVLRYEEWKREFDQQVQTDTFPQFTYMTLPNDHTQGTGSGVRDPRSFVAENDLATGRVVEAIANSPYWQDTVIFLLEDDPQSGADHIDSHRTVGTVIGPWVRRHYVSHTRYDMASMHRTIELILGLPPLSQFDQLAIPMRKLFTDTPDFTPYTAVPNSYPLFAMTRPNSGSDLSAQQDWSRPDRVPDELLNTLLWNYLKNGTGTPP